MSNLDVFVVRLRKIGIEVKLGGNYPWIYLEYINGVRVTETYRAEHGFTVAFMPIKYGDTKIKFTDLSEIFKLIRKYKNVQNNRV